MLGITHGVVALTNVDRVDRDRHDKVTAQLRTRLAHSPLREAEIVTVSAPTGLGMSNLRAALDRLVRITPAASDHGRPRLWADRAFSIRGAGTVVTGTLTGGALAAGQTLVTAPGGVTSRIRSIQVHDAPRDHVDAGHRVALNLPKLSVTDAGRGTAVIEPDRWHPARTVDASLTVLDTAPHPVTRRGAHMLHTGTGSWAVRLQILHEPSVDPGTTGVIRVRLPVSLPLQPNDRFVLRDAGADATIGGGVVLALDPRLPARRANPDGRWQRVVEEHGWIDAGHLARLTGVDREPTVGSWVVSDEALAQARSSLKQRLERAGPVGIRRSTIDPRTRAMVDTDLVPEIVLDGDHIRGTNADRALSAHPWLAKLRDDLFHPAPPDEVTPAEENALVDAGLVIRRDGICYHPDALEAALAEVRRLIEKHPHGITVSDVRTALATSRRYTLPLLGELDARGLTRREGPLRTLTEESLKPMRHVRGH